MKIDIEQGTLEGLQCNTKLSNKPCFWFLGIPYAEPPINDLRFMPPVKHSGWSGVLKAFSEGNKSLQLSVFTKSMTGSEDCLYLNVFVPQGEVNEKKSVMVFIHGGAFNFGSGSIDEYTPDYLLDENVIVVTINYRLNTLGFLNLDIEDCPGNMGLKDQLLALKWVKSNISAFGGDADNITIFGESAGSASVHSHLLSPQSTGLFQKAILQSGCIFNSWAFNEKHKEAALSLAKKLGCKSDDPKEIVKYLKNVPAMDLVNASILDGEYDFLNFKFVPSVESDAVRDQFLPARPDVLIETATPVPIIAGVNNMEGLLAFGEDRKQKLNEMLEDDGLRKFFNGHYNEDFVNKIKHFYFNERNIENETTKFENLCHFYSDAYFIKDFHRSFNYILKQGVASVYNYEFKFDGEINFLKKTIFATQPMLQKSMKGACHADELSYLFYGQLTKLEPKPDSPEFKMCRTLSKLWSNFAKTGNPNSSDFSFTWNNTSENDPKYLSIDGDDICMVDGFLYGSRVNLWENIK